MDIEFDPAKDAANIDKHGVSLAFGCRVFDDPSHLRLSAYREMDGETRLKAIGMIGNRLWTAIFVQRNHRIRFISVRKANDGEQRLYHRP